MPRTLEEYQKKWRIQINPDKTQAIFFTNKRARNKLPSRDMVTNGHPTPWVDEVKYLGVVLDKKLKFDKHVNHVINKLGKSTRALYALINRRSKLQLQNKLRVFKCILRPMFTYGAPVWGRCAKSHRKRLQVQQNKLLKMILNLEPFYPTDDVHRLAGVETLDEHIDRSCRAFWTTCQMSPNPLIEALTRQRL